MARTNLHLHIGQVGGQELRGQQGQLGLGLGRRGAARAPGTTAPLAAACGWVVRQVGVMTHEVCGYERLPHAACS